MRKLIYGAFLPLFLLAACDPGLTDRKPVIHTYEADGFRFTFTLQTEDGIVATVFHKGELVTVHYVIENTTNDTVYIVDTYSNPFYGDTDFEVIHRANGGEDIYYIHPPMPGIDLPCLHIPPYGRQSYKLCNENMRNEFPRGKYYMDFSPRFAYHDACCHFNVDEDMAEHIITIPNMKIKFTIQ